MKHSVRKVDHLLFPQLQVCTENPTPETVNLPDFSFTEGKKVPFKYVSKKKTKLKIPQTRDTLSQLSLPGSIFTTNLWTAPNRFYKVMKTQEDLSRSHGWRSEHMEFTVSSPSSQHTGQHCLCRWSRDAALKSGWHIKLMTKQWWQTSRQWSWDRKHGCQNTDREERKKPAQTLSQPPKNSNSHGKIERICLKMQTGRFFRHPLREWAPGQPEPSSACALTPAPPVTRTFNCWGISLTAPKTTQGVELFFHFFYARWRISMFNFNINL